MLPLNAANLSALPKDLPVPSYDRSALRTGIVHFGVGGFHRAHEAMYLDRLMNDGKALDWAICGVGVMPADQRMRARIGDAEPPGADVPDRRGDQQCEDHREPGTPADLENQRDGKQGDDAEGHRPT